eukprot:1536973-Rhodomonas_salina.2
MATREIIGGVNGSTAGVHEGKSQGNGGSAAVNGGSISTFASESAPRPSLAHFAGFHKWGLCLRNGRQCRHK